MPEFRNNMKMVASRDKELARLLKERSDLSQRFVAARRKLFKLSPQDSP